MAENKKAHHPRHLYMQDGLFNICAAAQDQTKLRELDDTRWYSVGGVLHWYITTITARRGNTPLASLLRGAYIVGDWHITSVPTYEEDLTKVRTVWHAHLRTNLMCATFRTAPNEWWCKVCEEPVPPGILFIARTEGLRKAR